MAGVSESLKAMLFARRKPLIADIVAFLGSMIALSGMPCVLSGVILSLHSYLGEEIILHLSTSIRNFRSS